MPISVEEGEYIISRPTVCNSLSLKLTFHMYVIRNPLSDMRHLSYVKSLSIYTISPADGSFCTSGM